MHLKSVILICVFSILFSCTSESNLSENPVPVESTEVENGTEKLEDDKPEEITEPVTDPVSVDTNANASIEISGQLDKLKNEDQPSTKKPETKKTSKTFNNFQNLAELKNEFKVKPSRFNIDPTKDTLIVCEKGTKFFFPNNCFEFEDGTTPDSTVEISIKECYDYTDFIGDNLTTTSGGEILETGGMVHVSITSNGQPIQVKDDQNYTICFPKNDNTNEMSFFYGAHDSNDFLDWELAENQADSTDNKTNTSPPQNVVLSGGIPAPKICKMRISLHTSGLGLNKAVKWNFKNEPGDVFSHFEDTFDPPQNLYDDMCGYGSTVIEYSMRFDKNGNLVELENTKSFNKSCDSLVATFIKSLPQMDMYSMGKNPSSNTKFDLGFSTTAIFDKKAYDNALEKMNAFKSSDTLKNVQPWEMNAYVMTATNLGWINCDRFWNLKAPKSDVFVEVESDYKTSTYLIFKEIKSMMAGINSGNHNRHHFSKIPTKCAVKIIAIQYVDGEPQLCVQDANTSDASITLNEFKPITIAALKSEINRVN